MSSVGQYYTTHYKYILDGLSIPKSSHRVVEPFAGKGDLLPFIYACTTSARVECFDIDPKHSDVVRRNTLVDPPSYSGAYVVTNPPYLARNKSPDKSLFDVYKVNDLYKCFIRQLITDECEGGVLIVPLNFWCSIRTLDVSLRRDFVRTFHIIRINVFEHPVFDDTTYTVCAFQFCLKKTPTPCTLHIIMYPSKNELQTTLTDSNNYTIGGEMYKLTGSKKYKVGRLTSKNVHEIVPSHIKVKCIDDNGTSRIRAMYSDTPYIEDTSRTYATIVITPSISIKKQKHMVNLFNSFVEQYRKKYYSLFLTNYREGARKRISFELVYSIIGYLLESECA